MCNTFPESKNRMKRFYPQHHQPFQLEAEFSPQGDQPEAIRKLVESIRAGNRYQTLLGVTGSGKTFTMANIIQELQRPTLIISHNKTLAAQLYSEFKSFFPNNAVEYFVSYYDYYQPEAYVPQTDTYIEKDSSINEEIERLRISASSSLIARRDVIVVASVSCIYGLGSPEDFEEMMIPLQVGEEVRRDDFLVKLVEILYDRNDIDFKRGAFRVRGEVVDVYPAYLESAIRIEFWGDTIESIRDLDPLTGSLGAKHAYFHLYPANQFITPKYKVDRAISAIREEMEQQAATFEKEKLFIEAQRIRMRTEYDIEMLQEIGFCNGIENYSRHLSGRAAGQRPWCLIDFFPRDFLLFVDESHVTMPQFGAMYVGDRSRKEKLVRYGFRLPSALDNRPLQPDEFQDVCGQTLFISATPSAKDLELSSVVAEQIIRPTGLLDPEMEMRPTEGQVEDLIGEINKAVEAGERVLVTTLTKRMSEDLTTFLREAKIRVEYLHSDIDAIERVEILRHLRAGKFDALIGVNLLREGLDLPEVALVAILDADKEGFLRNTTSLIQTAGRAARHEKGRVILYADRLNQSLRNTLEITHNRRARQIAFNQDHGITPRSVRRADQSSLHHAGEEEVQELAVAELGGADEVQRIIAELENEMIEASNALEFERAAILRDQIESLRNGGAASGAGRPGNLPRGGKYRKGKKRR
jgi:excinuclease ABC subunit B